MANAAAGSPALDGLTTEQLRNAGAIVGETRRLGGSQADAEAAITAAITESGLQEYANSKVPESFNYYHGDPGNEHVGHDGTSVGLFQQQNGWGGLSTAQRMDPVASSDAFLSRLLSTDPSLPAWVRDQQVQNSAYSDGSNYRASYGRGKSIADALWSGAGGPISTTPPASGGSGVSLAGFPSPVGIVGDVFGFFGSGLSGMGSAIGQGILGAIETMAKPFKLLAEDAFLIVIGAVCVLVGLIILAADGHKHEAAPAPPAAASTDNGDDDEAGEADAGSGEAAAAV